MTRTARRGAVLGSTLALLAASVLATPSVAVGPPSGPDRHGSDGTRGPLLADVRIAPGARSTLAEPTLPVERSWRIAPGVDYREWTAVLPQGQVRMHLLTADLDVRGVTLDLVSGPRVTDRAPLSRLLAARGRSAGVNADFFDIYDTGAPLGVGRSRTQGLRHGPRSGWNNTVAVGADGDPRVGTVSVTGEVRSRGRVVTPVSGLNDPVLSAGEVGVYTAAWGPAPGRRVVDGATAVRQVVVRDGRVRSSATRLSTGTAIRGTLLIGRGSGAAALKRLRVGQRVRVHTRAGRPGDRVVAGGSALLLRGGSYATSDNGELHPRTGFGWSRDTREVLLLVADGRSARSAGLTLRQLAAQLRSLGAEDALNLDGGGSSTLVAPDPAGVVGVRNSPSAGQERAVPNGLSLTW